MSKYRFRRDTVRHGTYEVHDRETGRYLGDVERHLDDGVYWTEVGGADRFETRREAVEALVRGDA